MASPLARAKGPTQLYSRAISGVRMPTPERRLRTEPSSRNVAAIWSYSSRRPASTPTMALSSVSSMSLKTPPGVHTERYTRPPVVFSKMSRTRSRRRQLCMNRLSKPMASAARPSQSRWLWMRESSCQMTRRYWARRGTSMSMSCSTAWL